MKKIVVLLITVVIVLGYVTESQAWGKRPWHAAYDSDKVIERVCLRLELNKKQRASFKSAHENLRAEMKQNKVKIQALQQKIAGELKKDQPNRVQIHKYVKQINQLRTSLHLKKIDNVIDLHKTLSPKQRKLQTEMMDKSRSQMKKGKSKRGKGYRNKSSR